MTVALQVGLVPFRVIESSPHLFLLCVRSCAPPMSTADPTSAPKDSQDDPRPPSVAQAAPAVSPDQSNKTTASAPVAATRTEGPGTGENTAEDKGETEETVGGDESKIDKRSTEDKPPSLTASLEKKTGNGKPVKTKQVSPKRAKEENMEKDGADKKQKPPKQKKKRRTLWVILHSCFAPPKTHTVHDEEVTSDMPTSKQKSGAQASKPSHTAEPSATSTVAPAQPAALQAPAALRIDSSRPHTPAQQEGEVIVPPTPGTPHLLPESETGGVTSGAVQAPGSTGNEHDESDHSTISEEPSKPYAEEDEEERLIMSGGNGIPIGPVCARIYSCYFIMLTVDRPQDGQPAPLLPPLFVAHKGRKCLVLDLDETLVHSSFKVRFSAFLSAFVPCK
jgi:hypothetical protein